MNIIPISSNPAITPFKSAFASDAAKTGSSSPFKDMFSDAVGNLEQLNDIKGQDSVGIMLGNVDDLGAVQINSQKAEVALQMLVQMRNRVLESYQEIMRINI